MSEECVVAIDELSKEEIIGLYNTAKERILEIEKSYSDMTERFKEQSKRIGVMNQKIDELEDNFFEIQLGDWYFIRTKDFPESGFANKVQIIDQKRDFITYKHENCNYYLNKTSIGLLKIDNRPRVSSKRVSD